MSDAAGRMHWRMKSTDRAEINTGLVSDAADQVHWRTKSTGQTEIKTDSTSDDNNSRSNWYQRANSLRSTTPAGDTGCHRTAMTDIDSGNGRSRRQTGRQLNYADDKTSTTKMSVHDDPKMQSNNTRDGGHLRGEDNGRRVGRKPAGMQLWYPGSSDGDEDDDRRPNCPQGRGRGKRGTPPDPGGGFSANKGGQFRRSSNFIKPDKFAGNDSFESFIMGFENAAKYNRWDEVDKCAWLRWSITGPTATILWGMD